jgi:hypothetical protein
MSCHDFFLCFLSADNLGEPESKPEAKADVNEHHKEEKAVKLMDEMDELEKKNEATKKADTETMEAKAEPEPKADAFQNHGESNAVYRCRAYVHRQKM